MSSEGVVVSILTEIDDDVFETADDAPFAFSLPFTVSTTHRRAITIPASIGAFKVHISNNSGAQVTATVRYQQAVVAAA